MAKDSIAEQRVPSMAPESVSGTVASRVQAFRDIERRQSPRIANPGHGLSRDADGYSTNEHTRESSPGSDVPADSSARPRQDINGHDEITTGDHVLNRPATEDVLEGRSSHFEGFGRPSAGFESSASCPPAETSSGISHDPDKCRVKGRQVSADIQMPAEERLAMAKAGLKCIRQVTTHSAAKFSRGNSTQPTGWNNSLCEPESVPGDGVDKQATFGAISAPSKHYAPAATIASGFDKAIPRPTKKPSTQAGSSQPDVHPNDRLCCCGMRRISPSPPVDTVNHYSEAPPSPGRQMTSPTRSRPSSKASVLLRSNMMSKPQASAHDSSIHSSTSIKPGHETIPPTLTSHKQYQVKDRTAAFEMMLQREKDMTNLPEQSQGEKLAVKKYWLLESVSIQAPPEVEEKDELPQTAIQDKMTSASQIMPSMNTWPANATSRAKPTPLVSPQLDLSKGRTGSAATQFKDCLEEREVPEVGLPRLPHRVCSLPPVPTAAEFRDASDGVQSLYSMWEPLMFPNAAALSGAPPRLPSESGAEAVEGGSIFQGLPSGAPPRLPSESGAEAVEGSSIFKGFPSGAQFKLPNESSAEAVGPSSTLRRSQVKTTPKLPSGPDAEAVEGSPVFQGLPSGAQLILPSGSHAEAVEGSSIFQGFPSGTHFKLPNEPGAEAVGGSSSLRRSQFEAVPKLPSDSDAETVKDSPNFKGFPSGAQPKLTGGSSAEAVRDSSILKSSPSGAQPKLSSGTGAEAVEGSSTLRASGAQPRLPNEPSAEAAEGSSIFRGFLSGVQSKVPSESGAEAAEGSAIFKGFPSGVQSEVPSEPSAEAADGISTSRGLGRESIARNSIPRVRVQHALGRQVAPGRQFSPAKDHGTVSERESAPHESISPVINKTSVLMNPTSPSTMGSRHPDLPEALASQAPSFDRSTLAEQSDAQTKGMAEQIRHEAADNVENREADDGSPPRSLGNGTGRGGIRETTIPVDQSHLEDYNTTPTALEAEALASRLHPQLDEPQHRALSGVKSDMPPIPGPNSLHRGRTSTRRSAGIQRDNRHHHNPIHAAHRRGGSGETSGRRSTSRSRSKDPGQVGEVTVTIEVRRRGRNPARSQAVSALGKEATTMTIAHEGRCARCADGRAEAVGGSVPTDLEFVGAKAGGGYQV